VRLEYTNVIGLIVHGFDPADEPNLNTGTPWRAGEDQDIRWMQIPTMSPADSEMMSPGDTR
jgi:hypothetical protein